MPANYIKFSEEQMEEIVDRYKNKIESLEIIAKDYGVSMWKIQKELTNVGVKMRKHTEYTPGRDKANKARKVPRDKNSKCLRCNGKRKKFIILGNDEDFCYECFDKVKRNRRRVLYKYGLTVNDFANILKKQNNSCDICKVDFFELTNIEMVCIDHCHKTGKVRGLLCSTCNSGLGMFKDDENNLINAINYLKKKPASAG
jgi:hypothetical protein